MTDDELSAWIRTVVRNDTQENLRLDYKRTIDIESAKSRADAAEDIASFANTMGGVVLYGVPEDPARANQGFPSQTYGLPDSAPEFRSRLENVFVSAIAPALPEFDIRAVRVAPDSSDVVYLVWTPESWLAPHMTRERYYRRGHLRAVPMSEHEVRSLYERRLARAMTADESAEDLQVGSHAAKFVNPCGTHLLVYPSIPGARRIDFWLGNVRDWMTAHAFSGDSEWLPSHLGITSELYEHEMPIPGGRMLVEPYARINRQGAYSVWQQTQGDPMQDKPPFQIAYLPEFEALCKVLAEMAAFYEFLNYPGPLTCRLRFWSAQWPLYIPMDRGNAQSMSDPRADLTLEVTDYPAAELIREPGRLSKRFADELWRAFSIGWFAPWIDETGAVRRLRRR